MFSTYTIAFLSFTCHSHLPNPFLFLSYIKAGIIRCYASYRPLPSLLLPPLPSLNQTKPKINLSPKAQSHVHSSFRTGTTMSMNSASLDADSLAPSGSGTPNVRSPEEVVAAATPAVMQQNQTYSGDSTRVSVTSGELGEGAGLTFQEIQYKDGGAHWYRASAIILRYHK